MSSDLSIGFLSTGDARHPRAWSGTVYNMAQALERSGAALEYIGPMDLDPLRWDMLVARILRKLGGRPTAPLRSRRAARVFARQIDRAMARGRPDVLLSPAGSVLLADLPPGCPVLYSSDSTLALMRGYYPKYTRMSARSLAELDRLERRAIDRADVLLYPTRWAAASAVADYAADPAKVHVVPYGANLEAPAREAALAPRPDGPVELVFIGVDWVRKGGAIAVGALDRLGERGIDAHMTVIGCVPPDGFDRPNLTVIPFLDKKDPAQRGKLVDCYLRADCLVLPTRQECYGIVFCEAAAHGVPSVATATGGVPDVIRDGVTGKVVPPEGDGAAYADAIEALLDAPGGIAAARLRARDDYEARLNWESWAARTMELARTLI